MLKVHNLADKICAHRDNGGHATEVPAGARLLFCNGQVGARPDASVPEDAGEQIEVIFDRIGVILDAADFTGDPVAMVRLPHRIPPGFHGNWVEAG